MFTIPNYTIAPFRDQGRAMQADIDAIVRGIAGIGLYSGCAVTQGTLMVPNVSIGYAAFSGVRVAVSATIATIPASDPSNPRYDLISVSSGGVVTVTQGTAAQNPTKPSWPAGHATIAEVYVEAGATSIVDDDIVDKRLFGRWPVLIVAASDESDADNTLHSDGELFFPIGANEVWIVQMGLLFQTGTSATPDMQITIALPASGVASGSVFSLEAGATVTSDVWTFGTGFQIATPADFGGFGVLSTSVSGATPGNGQFVIRTGATPGTCQLQWAQRVTTPGTPTVRKTDSYLWAVPVTI